MATGGSSADADSFTSQVLADTPIAYYRLDESLGASTAMDSSGQANHGSASQTGITLEARSPLGRGREALFDGLGPGRIVVPNHVTLNPQQVTIEALITWSGQLGTTQQRILEKSFRADKPYWPGYGLSIDPPVRDQPEREATLRVEMSMSTDRGVVIFELNGKTRVTPGDPIHVAATYDGSTMSIYVNGALDGSRRASGNLASEAPFSDLGIGNQVERDRPFNGFIDEVVLYGRALSPDRIRAHVEVNAAPDFPDMRLKGMFAPRYDRPG